MGLRRLITLETKGAFSFLPHFKLRQLVLSSRPHTSMFYTYSTHGTCWVHIFAGLAQSRGTIYSQRWKHGKQYGTNAHHSEKFSQHFYGCVTVIGRYTTWAFYMTLLLGNMESNAVPLRCTVRNFSTFLRKYYSNRKLHNFGILLDFAALARKLT